MMEIAELQNTRGWRACHFGDSFCALSRPGISLHTLTGEGTGSPDLGFRTLTLSPTNLFIWHIWWQPKRPEKELASKCALQPPTFCIPAKLNYGVSSNTNLKQSNDDRAHTRDMYLHFFPQWRKNLFPNKWRRTEMKVVPYCLHYQKKKWWQKLYDNTRILVSTRKNKLNSRFDAPPRQRNNKTFRRHRERKTLKEDAQMIFRTPIRTAPKADFTRRATKLLWTRRLDAQRLNKNAKGSQYPTPYDFWHVQKWIFC